MIHKENKHFKINRIFTAYKILVKNLKVLKNLRLNKLNKIFTRAKKY